VCIRDRPFNLQGGGGLWFFVSFRNFFSDNTRVRIFFFFCRAKREFFFQNSTLGYMTKTLNQIIFFSLHQNQNIFFSNIGNQNIFLENFFLIFCCQANDRLFNTFIYLMLKDQISFFIALPFKECVKCNDLDIRNIFLSVVVTMI
jgi:hypothetical protein